MDEGKKVVSANEFRLLDANGNTRAVFSAGEDSVEFAVSNVKGKPQIKLLANDSGLSSFNLYDAEGNEKIEISVDDQGTHIHLAGEGNQESYLFLKNTGASGLVLTDKEGNRRIEAKVGVDLQPELTVYPLNKDPKHF
jgi:hypothetical protein